jgi:hypothetical protein
MSAPATGRPFTTTTAKIGAARTHEIAAEDREARIVVEHQLVTTWGRAPVGDEAVRIELAASLTVRHRRLRLQGRNHEADTIANQLRDVLEKLDQKRDGLSRTKTDPSRG